jgi:FtsH-binding integral membrane protein
MGDSRQVSQKQIRYGSILLTIPAGILIFVSLVMALINGDLSALGWIFFFGVFGFFEWKGLHDNKPGGTLSEVFWVFTWEPEAGFACHARTVIIWIGLLGLLVHMVAG